MFDRTQLSFSNIKNNRFQFKYFSICLSIKTKCKTKKVRQEKVRVENILQETHVQHEYFYQSKLFIFKLIQGKNCLKLKKITSFEECSVILSFSINFYKRAILQEGRHT